MNIADVMDDLGTALEAVDGLRVFPYSADRIVPPAAIVGWPDPITYDATMARGADTLTVPLFVVVGKLDARTSRDRLAKYLDGAGDDSVKDVLEAASYTAFDSVRVQEARVDGISVAGTDYLGAVFQLDIIGPGGA
ncbi:hypothetical protein [Amycolatopsis sp. cmx-4-68]|uniref:hypothetical protein n=1 Tax=Amycolatopsis sp. cmx-4-68 TaxID=2790938 RepID=UPI0039782138